MRSKELRMEKKETLNGFAIVIADRGWVYVGDVEINNKWCLVKNALNIRRWGTSHGLGELAKDGPKENTKTDNYGTVSIPLRAVVSILDADKSKWT